MNKKVLHLLGSILLAAGTVAACAGDGTEDTGSSGNGGSGSGNGGNGGSQSSGNGGSGSGNGGTSGSGNGGTSGSGNGGTSGSGNGGSSGTPSAGGLSNKTGGYYMSGGLKGYLWTAADEGGSSILPEDFSIAPTFCAQGMAAMVAGEAYDTTWGTLLGWNVNQADLPPNPEGTAALTGTFTIGIGGSNVPSGLRLKVEVAGVDYCTDLTTGSNSVPVSMLKKECWMAGGAAYAGEPVKNIAVQVTTNAEAAKPFNFCLTSLSYTP